jgi:hypothetical protein
MSRMGSTSQVTNYDRFIRETGKGVASIGNVRAPIQPFVGHSGWIGESWGTEQPLLRHGYGGSS